MQRAVGATGARAQYAVRTSRSTLEANWEVDLIVTNAGSINLDLECSMTPEELANRKGIIFTITKTWLQGLFLVLLNMTLISYAHQVEQQ